MTLDQMHAAAKKEIDEADEGCSVDMALKRFAARLREWWGDPDTVDAYREMIWEDYMENQ